MGSDKSLTIRLRLESFIPLPTDEVALMTFNDWTPAKRNVFMAILSHSQKKGYCFASQDYIAKICGVNRSSSIRLVNELIREGWLKKGKFKDRVRTLVPSAKTLDRFFNE